MRPMASWRAYRRRRRESVPVRRMDRPVKLKSDATQARKMRVIGISAAACLALGLIIHPWNPIIKRICTSSFTLYSTGWVLLMLLAFYWVVEVKFLSQMDLSVDRNRRELDLYLLPGYGPPWMADQFRGSVHPGLSVVGGLRASGSVLRGLAGHVVSVLLALQPQSLLQIVRPP